MLNIIMGIRNTEKISHLHVEQNLMIMSTMECR
mgnify:CR=1 FL=1